MFNSRRKREQREAQQRRQEWEERHRCLIARWDNQMPISMLAIHYGYVNLVERALPDMLLVSAQQALEMETHFRMETV